MWPPFATPSGINLSNKDYRELVRDLTSADHFRPKSGCPVDFDPRTGVTAIPRLDQ